MDQEDRDKLLERINRQGATVGSRIPETITVGDSALPLREFVIETRKLEAIPEDASELVRKTMTKLTDRREELERRLKTDPLEREQAERIAAEIVGIDRAINALENLRRPSYGEDAARSQIDDYKRWLGFLESVTE